MRRGRIRLERDRAAVEKNAQGLRIGRKLQGQSLTLAALHEVAASIESRSIATDDDLEQRPRNHCFDDRLHAEFDERQPYLDGLPLVAKVQVAIVIEMRQLADV